MNAKALFSVLFFSVFLLAGCNNSDKGLETFVVGPELKDCVGVGPMKCLVVNGQFFYDTIEGFQYEEGFTYELSVKKSLAFDTEDPRQIPADANKYQYELVEVLQKRAE